MYRSRVKAALLAAVTAPFFLGALNATADQFGTTVATDWQRWAAFSQGGDVDADVTATNQTGGSYIKGDVGVWGSGNINLSGNAILDGNLYYRTGGTLKLTGMAKITGSIHHDAAGDTILQTSSNEAFQESVQLNQPDSQNYSYSINGGPTKTSPPSPLTNINNQSITITGTGRVVLQLQNFVLNDHNTITLVGNTAATTFVFNISKQFSLNGQSQIVLSGIPPSNVVYNVLGNGPDIHVGGSAMLKGIVLANNRTVTLDGNSITTGEVVANVIRINDHAQLIHASQ